MDNDKSNFLYCNQVQIATSPWDIFFSFQRAALARLENGQLSGKPNIVEELQVSMSPAHAKLMLVALYSQIAAYEKDVVKAKIPLDQANQEKYDSFIKTIKSST